MDRNLAKLTIFTFFFAIVSATRISFIPNPTDSPLFHANCDLLPTRSGSHGAVRVQKSDKDMLRVDLTPRSDYARFHAINRRFFDQHRVVRRPYQHSRNPFVIPRSEISHRNEVISNGRFDVHRHGPSARLKFKHDYEHNHNRNHQHHHSHHNNKDVFMPKHKFSKVKSLVHQHKEKTREHEASTFMTSIRKFLKHSFE